jgi:SAM-dependent methyltransferase
MVDAYARARPVPSEVARAVVVSGRIDAATSVLDVGGGTGSLTLQLAASSRDVTSIDSCEPFVRLAKRRAAARGVAATFKHFSAEHVALLRRRFDVIVASQVLHWLHPVSGLNRLLGALAPGGTLVAVESKAVLPDGHPLRALGYGIADDDDTIAANAHAHALRYDRLCRALSRPPVALTDVWLFRQRRDFDADYARAYFFDEEVAAAYPGEAPWQALGAALARSADARCGHLYWMVARYDARADRSHEALMHPTVAIPFVSDWPTTDAPEP